MLGDHGRSNTRSPLSAGHLTACQISPGVLSLTMPMRDLGWCLWAMAWFPTAAAVEWSGLTWLTQSLRIEQETLQRITRKQIRTLATVYKQKRSNHFLSELAKELDLD